MSDFLTTIQKKREDARIKQEDEQSKKAQIDAVTTSSQRLEHTFTRQSARTRTHQQPVEVKNFPSVATSEDVSSAAQLISASLESHYEEAHESHETLEEMAGSLETIADILKRQPKPPKAADFPKPLKTVSVDNLPNLAEAISPIVEAINSKDYKPTFSPVIKTETPIVNVEAPDLTRLEELLTKEEATEIELEDFKAQDLDNASDSLQYVGLQDSKGNWQLIEFDVERNSMRYRFGTGNYEVAWEKRVSSVYNYLAEAYRAFSS